MFTWQPLVHLGRYWKEMGYRIFENAMHSTGFWDRHNLLKKLVNVQFGLAARQGPPAIFLRSYTFLLIEKRKGGRERREEGKGEAMMILC